MSRELFFEIGTEEIPSRFLPGAISSLKGLLEERLRSERLSFKDVHATATPRRLIGRVTGLSEKQADELVERAGPPWESAFSPDGRPTKMALGFAKSLNVDPGDLVKMASEKGDRAGVRKTIPGRATQEILAGILEKVFTDLPWPKSMRWGYEKTRFVRPVHWIMVLFGGRPVDLSFAGVRSGETTYGHRFHAPEQIQPRSYEEYVDSLRRAKVLVEYEERKRVISASVSETARAHGCVFDEDNPANRDLIEQVVGLVEWPCVYVGTIPQKYLSLPRLVLVTSMTKHQKYFSFTPPGADQVIDKFVAIGGLEALDKAVVTKGYERVLNARLADASFFFEEDLKHPLAETAKRLKGVIFHRKLGSYEDKVARANLICDRLASSVAPQDRADAVRALAIAKADLLTAMVGEFPELQGVMGAEYARRQGETPEVAAAIFEHYLPRFAGDILPTTSAGALCSVADKLDSIVACLGIGLGPTGAGDPYALRRQALGIIQILRQRNWRIALDELIGVAIEAARNLTPAKSEASVASVREFFQGRLGNLLKQEGFPSEVVDGVIAVRFLDIVEVVQRVESVARFAKSDEFIAFAVAFKRVANIIGGQLDGEVDESLFEGEPEKALWGAYKGIREDVDNAVRNADYLKALQKISGIRPQVDVFFDKILVMHENESLRRNRLSLLFRTASLFSDIADFRRM